MTSIAEREFETLALTWPDDGILQVTLNRPDQLNAVSETMHHELIDLLAGLRTEPGIGAVVLTGAGKAFCSGGDFGLIKAHQTRDYRWSIRTLDEGVALIRDLLSIRQPLVCAINGHAMGLGATLALSADYSVMSQAARIGDTHVKVGLVAGDGGTVIWPALVGPLRAKELLMSGQPITAEHAVRIGLVSHVTAREDVLSAALEKASELAGGPREAIAWTKQLINSSLLRLVSEHMPFAMALEARSMALPDFKEGLDAVVQKRPAIWPSGLPEAE